MNKTQVKHALALTVGVLLVICTGLFLQLNVPVFVKAIVSTVFLCILVSGAVFYYKREKESTLLEAQLAISRVNEELQRVSKEREQSISALLKQRKLLENIVSAIPYCVYWKDAKSIFTGCNQKFAEFMSVSRPDEVIGRTYHDLIADRELADFFVQCETEIMKTTVPLINLRKTFSKPDGKDVDTMVTKVPLRDTNGKITGTLGIITEVADSGNAGGSFDATTMQCLSAISNMAEGVLVTDSRGLITEANPYFCELIGNDKERVAGSFIFSCFSKYVNDQLKTIIAKFQEGSCRNMASIQAMIGDRTFRINIQPSFTENSYDGSIVNVIDINILIETTKKAEYASCRKSKFLSSVSHQGCAPITSIIETSESLRQGELSREQTEFVNTIYTAATDLMYLLDGILDISKLDTGTLEVEGSEIDISQMLTSVSDSVLLKAEEEGLEVRIEICDDAPKTINSDANKLRQVLVYLTNNALKFTNQGHVRIKVSADEPSGDSEICESVRFSVKDTGCGIDRNKLQRIRKILSEGDRETFCGQSDTGFGLPIGGKLISLLGGKLEIESTPLAGSEFYFTIPCQVQCPEADVPCDPAASANTDGDRNDDDVDELKYILVVDDVAENRELIKVLMEKEGYAVEACSDGKEAVSLCDAKKYGVILMDIQMDVMDGLEATRIIRSQGENTKTGIIAMTACTSNRDESQCLDAGCNDFILKPIKKEQLVNKVWRLVAQNKQLIQARRGDEITSFLADNPDYHKTIDMFVDNLAERIQAMQDSLDNGDFQDLANKVHSLKGLGSFAGFSIYSDMAKEMEDMLDGNQTDSLQKQLDELVRFCDKTQFAIPEKETKNT